MKTFVLAAIAAFGAAVPAQAATLIFSDTFDGYSASQVPWAGNGVWTTGNTVDLVKSGEFSLTCLGAAGNCVDLTGNVAGSISKAFTLGPGRYQIAYSYTGNQLDGDGGGPYPQIGFTAAVGSAYSVNTGPLANNSTAFQSRVDEFVVTTAGSYTLSFTQDPGGNQFRGSILDSVSLSAVPEPATWALMIMGFGLIGGAMRRAKPRVNVAFA